MLVTALGSEMEAQDGKIIDCFVLLNFSLPYLPRSGQPRDQASYYKISQCMSKDGGVRSHFGVLHNPLNIKITFLWSTTNTNFYCENAVIKIQLLEVQKMEFNSRT